LRTLDNQFDPIRGGLQEPPSVGPENRNANSPSGEVLLTGKILVAGHEQVEPLGFGGGEQRSVR